MALRIRLSRRGAKKNPFYRIVVQDGQAPRDGKFVEIIGTYDPLKEKNNEKLTLKKERYDFWFGKGARPTRTIAQLVQKSVQ